MKHIIVAMLLTLLLASCEKGNGQDTVEVQTETEAFCLNEQLKKTTKTISLQLQPIREQLTLTGKIDYDENKLVSFRSLLNGVVESVRFELGDKVSKGQVLAVITSGEVQELFQQKNLYRDKINLLNQQIQTKQEMARDGLASETEVLELKHELSEAQIELDKTNFILQYYKTVGKHSFQILSPQSGYIIQKNISVGQNISDEDELFTVSDLQKVWVMVNVYASSLQHISQGDEVKVKTVAFPDDVYTGVIDKIYNVFDDNEHVLKARVILNNTELKLMPGLSADILVDNKKSSVGEAFAVPNEAVIFNDNKEYIVVYKDDCDIRIEKITRKAGNDELTYVNESFGNGEQVVSSNALIIFEELNQ